MELHILLFPADQPGDQRGFNSDIAFYLRKIFGKGGCPWRRCASRADISLVGRLEMLGEAVDPLVVVRVAVIAEFVLDIDQNDEAAGDAYGQPQEVDQGISLVACDITPGGFDIAEDHVPFSL